MKHIIFALQIQPSFHISNPNTGTTDIPTKTPKPSHSLPETKLPLGD